MELKEVLTRLKTENGYTTQELAEKSGIPKGTLNKLLNGETKDPRRSTLRMLAEALRCPLEVLTNAMQDDAMAFNREDIVYRPRKRVPILGEIAAGMPMYAEEEYGEYAECDGNMQSDFALRVHGDSMVGARLTDGDIVFIRAQEDVDDGQIAAVAIDQSVTLKRVYHISGGVQLLSENPKYAPMLYTEENSDSIRILGVAVAFQSRL